MPGTDEDHPEAAAVVVIPELFEGGPSEGRPEEVTATPQGPARPGRPRGSGTGR
jgi:hypothetical protein